MSIAVVVQYATALRGAPSKKEIKTWVKATLQGRRQDAQVTVRIVDEQEGAELNQRSRKRPGPTNVLSFPWVGLEDIAPDILGDIIICAPVVEREARQQNKSPSAHWVHMVVHGTLHLLGFNHTEEQQALIMERLETEILSRLGYPDPYNS